MEVSNLETQLGKLGLKTPLIGASGLFGYGMEHAGLVDYAAFGAIATKTLTVAPREGNPPPRMFDLGCGILNSIGLENVGCDAFLKEKLPAIHLPCKLIASIGGDAPDEFRRLANRLSDAAGIDAIEVNVSCPNVVRGGIALGRDPAATREVVAAARRETRLPVIAKLPPLVAGLADVARAACDGGADALTVANTFPGMVIDVEAERPVLGGVSGGYSGRAIRPMSLLLVWTVRGAVEAPIIAAGGIETAQDAIEYLLAGATALQIGSVILRDLDAPSKILKGLRANMEAKGYKTIEEVRDRARR
jgi:dihydroorotate dehydrogenase (NAD+) catalytic subunit